MSDIRFEGWLHRTGTGGVYQDSAGNVGIASTQPKTCLLYTSPSPRDRTRSRMPSSA